MPITASAKGVSGPRQIAPPGTHVGRCYSIIDLGTREKTWEGRTRKSREVRFSWELPTELAVFGEDGKEQPFSVHKNYTLSLNEKATLRHDLENWRGRPFTEEEAAKFDVTKVLTFPCMLTVTHVTKGDKTYANVTAVTAIPKIVTCPPQVNPSFVFSLESFDQRAFDQLPDFLRTMIIGSDEYQARSNAAEEEPHTVADEAPTNHDGPPF